MSRQPEPPGDFMSTYEEEGFGEGFIRTVKNKPVVFTGLGAMAGALGYGYWRWKTKGFLVSPSLFLMQLRVGAQAAVVGCITVAMTYNLINTHLLGNKPEGKK